MLSGLKTQLKQKDIEIYRYKSKIIALQAEMDQQSMNNEGNKYGCTKDHDHQGSAFKTPRPSSSKLDDDNQEELER